MSRTAAWSLRIVWVALLAGLPVVASPFWLKMLTLALIYSLVVFSINVLTGFSGLLSFGQAGFVGAGAYTYGVMSIAGVPLAGCIVAALALPTLLGLLLGLPAARLKGHYLAIGTLGFGVLGAQLLNNMVDVTRGPMGLIGIRSVGLDRTAWFYLLLAISLAVMQALNALERHSFLGVMFKSVKYDEIAAEAAGIATFGVKLAAFCASAFLAGLCGVLLAMYMRFLTPDLFDTAESFRYLMMAVVGGAGSATGGFIASLLLTAVPELLRSLGETNVRLLVYGIMVLFVLWFVPDGIGGLLDRMTARQPSCGGRGRKTSAETPAVVPRAATPVLQVKAVAKSFGGVKALQGVDLAGLEGEVHGLIGPNGAGKSTLIGCIAGVNRVDSGEILFRGARIDRLSAHERARLGVARTFQKIRLSQQLTVFENVAAGLAARWFRVPSGYLRIFSSLSSPSVTVPVFAALDAAGVAPLAGLPLSFLPYGKRHLVELARTLVAQPDVILLDEPATGLSGDERENLMGLVRRIAAQGALVVLVEHDLELVGRLCDRVTVIEQGRRIFSGTPAAAQHDPDVVRAYLGSSKFAIPEGDRAPAA
jgi:branched-chain amino acid transport system permease protein